MIIMRKPICCLLTAIMIIGSFPFAVFATGPTHYTYAYNEWGVPIPSPDAYKVSAYILGQHLYFEGENIGAFRSPQDIHVHGNLLYLADSGNHRIIILEFSDDTTFEVIDIKTYAMLNGEPTLFNNPHGIFVSQWQANFGQIWIADTSNQRVLHLDKDWNVITEIRHPGIYGRCPDSEVPAFREGYGISLLNEASDFLPSKLTVDFSGRLFVQTRHINRGLMEFDRYGFFAGYMGAPPVQVSIVDQFWRLIATQEQRERMMLNVPVEYTNLSIDHEGFIYVTTSSENVDPVARLNAMGGDVLIRNGWEDPIGDLWWGTGADRSGPSELVAVTALPNNSFVVFDRNRGRLFAYDQQGQMLYIWGGPGNREGFFTFPTALDNMGHTIFALDGGRGADFAALTRFDLTEYGALINEALDMYQRGLYEESYGIWNDVLRINGNFGLAYTGIARARLRQGQYREAMHYFRLQNDYRNYGRAFGFYRRIWMEQYFWIFAVGLGMLMIVPPAVKKVIKIRKEINEA
jgi:sugar lactone lactonase YvrE